MSDWTRYFIEKMLETEEADAAWDRDFLPSPHDPYAVAEQMATRAHIPFLIEALASPSCGKYAKHALDTLRKVDDGRVDHDAKDQDEEEEYVDVHVQNARAHGRVLLDAHAGARARTQAAHSLMLARIRVHALPVLDHFIAAGEVPESASDLVPWVAPLPRSEELLGVEMPHRMIFELVRRRRCAGLTTRAERVREAMRASTDVDPECAGLIALELGDDTGAELRALDVSDADVCFLDGFIEHRTMVTASAYGIYAELLRRDPRCRHAAFQIAWIDRAFNAPDTAERGAWLRSLGVEESLLDKFEQRHLPHAFMPCSRFDDHHLEVQPDAALAKRAWVAGLASVAANHYGAKWPKERERAKAAAASHIDRLWK